MRTSPASGVRPLENGDRMTREEFHALYEQHPEIRRAELIEGVVHVPSPVGLDHSESDGLMMSWLAAFVGQEPRLRLLPNATLRPDDDNEIQPDLCITEIRAGERGRGKFLDRAPELVVEISGSTVSYDLHSKMEIYRRAGVQEYIVWRVYDEAIDWFELRDGRYERIEPDERGVIASRVFPGLRLDLAKMLAGDLAGVLAEQARVP